MDDYASSGARLGYGVAESRLVNPRVHLTDFGAARRLRIIRCDTTQGIPTLQTVSVAETSVSAAAVFLQYVG